VCRPYYGKNGRGEEMNRTSLAPRMVADAKVFVVEELEDVFFNFNSKKRMFKYGALDMQEYNIEENTLYNLLHLICGNIGVVN
jgi:hypothetical protein